MKLCECGCGQPAPIAGSNNATRGYIKGQPVRFLKNHDKRKHDYGYDVDENGCWIFRGSVDKDGYGQMGKARAHRVYFEKYVGPIPDGLQLDHVYAKGCRSKACVNPDHLEPVTPKENSVRHYAVNPGVPWRRLSDEQVREIRTSSESCAALGRKLGMSQQHIWFVRNRRTYRDVAC